MRREDERLRDILDAISAIERYARDAFILHLGILDCAIRFCGRSACHLGGWMAVEKCIQPSAQCKPRVSWWHRGLVCHQQVPTTA